MSEDHNRLSPLESVILKSVSLMGIVLFTGLMVSRWSHALNQVALAKSQETQTPVAATQIRNSTPAEATVAEVQSIQTPEAVTSVTPMDQGRVEQLQSALYEQINGSWQSVPSFSQSLVYQVAVSETGAIAQTTPLNLAASDHIHETPLEKLVNSTTSPTTSFLVIMTPTGNLEISPALGK